MIILQVIDSLYRGGAQKVVLDIVRALPQHKHIVCYWTNETDLREDFLKEGVALIQLPFAGTLTIIETYFFLRSLVRKHKPDVIHSHMFIPNLLTRWLPKEFALISTYHGEVFSKTGLKGLLIIALEKWTLSRCDVVIAVSNYVQSYLKKKLGTDRAIEVVHNYGQTFPASKPYTLQLPLKLVATSNNQPYKDYPLLINAMSALSDQSITLDIYGNGMEPLKKLAADLKVVNVKFCGVIPDVTKVLNNYSAYIIASHSGEGFSLSLLEAMNVGLPIICSNIPQFKEAVGPDAIIFEKSNVQDLVGKLREVIEQPETLLSKARLSNERALLFTKENFLKNITDLYSRYDKRS
ncbi:MAG TPA: glycosyltransferase family 4 protein [Cyclobacteriaceae bacterium]|nr:glycosyltransferase family 4 protein [Cyclobacteriaceae bacterium]